MHNYFSGKCGSLPLKVLLQEPQQMNRLNSIAPSTNVNSFHHYQLQKIWFKKSISCFLYIMAHWRVAIAYHHNTIGMIIIWKNTLFHCTVGSFCSLQGGCISHASTRATSSSTRLSWWPWGIGIAWHTDQLVTFLMN